MLDFGKPIQDLTEKDLQERLIDDGYCECLWAEYKRQFLEPPERLATTLAAFANQDGGWLFVGVEADDDNTPTSLCGVCGRGQATERLANIVAAHIDPVPPFVSHWVDLADTKRAVLAVRVWEGADTPYVLRKTGRIHVRVADTNQPNDPVKDRSGIERLFRKSRDTAARFEEARRRTYYGRILDVVPWPGGLTPRPMVISAQVYPRAADQDLVPRLFTEATESLLEGVYASTHRALPTGCRHEQSRVVCVCASDVGQEWPGTLFGIALDGSVEWTELFGVGDDDTRLTEDDFRSVGGRARRIAVAVYERIGYGGTVELRLEAAHLRGRSLQARPQTEPSHTRMFPARQDRFSSRRDALVLELEDEDRAGRILGSMLQDVRRFFGCTTYDR